ncbi:conserved hypothetical protein [Beggiatoa sp. PS]|nr:conserved hypothetical protein [Beggiatoa sp. PS]
MTTHTIKTGETLYHIATTNGLSVDQLLKMNPGLDPNHYHAGQTINLSSSSPSTSSHSSNQSTTYAIKAGETLYHIATTHGLSVDQLLEMNPGLDSNHYSAGQTINLSSAGGYHPTATHHAPTHTASHSAPPPASGGAPWFEIAKREMAHGVKEIAGRVDNPRIVEYHQATTLKATDDETPWCSAFANWCMKQAGIEGTQNARAASWLNWGQKLDSPREGCIVVVKTSSSHHVTFYYSDYQGGRFSGLGGNQSDQVKISHYSKSSVRAYRWPHGH